MNEYKCVTSVKEIKEYLGNSKLVAFDFETAPNDDWRDDERASLDPARAHICGCSFSVKEGTGIYVPIEHKTGENIDKEEFFEFLREFLSDTTIIKVAHNIAFESMFAYSLGIVIMPPVYDTICASQMSLKGVYDFRNLSDSGLKKLAGELCHEELPTYSSVTDGRSFDEMDGHDSETVRYGSADSDISLRLYHIFNNWFDKYLPRHRYIVEEIESPVAVYLGIMKCTGVPLDLDLMNERKAEAEAEMEKIKDEIQFMIGDVDIGSNCSTQEFKDYLYKNLKLPVLKTTEKNREAADDTAMIMLKEWCDENRPELSQLFTLVQEYRKWGKIKSTYIDGYLKYLNPVTNRIHPDIFGLSTDTGRMNCRNPNVQNCFDDKTEILTLRGFVRFADLNPDDKVAQWDDGNISFVKPLEYICHRYDGDMVKLKNRHIDLVMTPEHRCLVKNRTGQYRVVSAENYPLRSFKQLQAGEYAFGEKHLSAAFVTLLAAAQADGNYHCGGIVFGFQKARKYRRLKNALNNLMVPHSDNVCKDGRVFIRMLKGKTTAKIMDLLGPEKKWGPWLLEYDRETIKNLLIELPQWDGCFTRQNAFRSVIKSNADWVQILYALTGNRAYISGHCSSEKKNTTCYTIDMVPRNYSATDHIAKTRVPYHGNVYCVSVPSSYIVVRRNDNISITGNCPRSGNDPIGVRNFIKAPDGSLIMSLDFSQIELRVGAFYCRDKVMMDTYKNGGDIHAATTAIIFGETLAEAEDKHRKDYKEHRTIAKNVNFGTFYGLFPAGLQRTLKFKAGVDKTIDECEDILTNLKHGYRGLMRWQGETKAQAAKKQYAETWLGRRRYLPGILSDNWAQKSFAERCALNTPIQGTAADILKLAAVRILKGLPERPWLKPILQIHDELAFIVPKEHLQEAVKFVRDCMLVRPFPEFDVPLEVEASAGSTFGNMTDLEDDCDVQK